MALFLANQGPDKDVFRSNLTVYGCLLNLVTVATFGSQGLLTEATLAPLLWALPAMVAGVVLGGLLVSRLSPSVFRRVALVLILVSGVWTLVTVPR